MDRKKIDQADTDDKGRQTDADKGHRQNRFAEPAGAIYTGIDTKRDANAQGNHSGNKDQFKRRRDTFGDHLRHRPLGSVGETKLPLQGILQEPGILNEERVLKAENLANALPILKRCFLTNHIVDRIANIIKERKGNE